MRLALITVLSSLVLPVSAFAGEAGTYRPGKAYDSVAANAPSDCASQCRGDAQCKSWNFIRPRKSVRSGVCEFNSEMATPVPSPISESGTNESVRASSRFVSSGTNTVRVQSAGAAPSMPTQSLSVTPGQNPAYSTMPAPQSSMAMKSDPSPFTPRTYGSTAQAPASSEMASPMPSQAGSHSIRNRSPSDPMAMQNMSSQNRVNPQTGRMAPMAMMGAMTRPHMPNQSPGMPANSPRAGMMAPHVQSQTYSGMYPGAAPQRTFTGGYLSQNALGPQPPLARMMPPSSNRAMMQSQTGGMRPMMPGQAYGQMAPQNSVPPSPTASLRQQLLNNQPLNAQPQGAPAMKPGQMNNRPGMPSMMQNQAMAHNPYMAQNPYAMRSPYMPQQTMPQQVMQPRKKGLPIVGNLFSRNRGPQPQQMGHPMMNRPQMAPRSAMPQQMMNRPMMSPTMPGNAPMTPTGNPYPGAYQMDMARSRAPQMPGNTMMAPATAPRLPAYGQSPQAPRQMGPASNNSLYGSLHDDVRAPTPMMGRPNPASGGGAMPVVRSVPSQPVMSSTLGGLAGGPGYPTGL